MTQLLVHPIAVPAPTVAGAVESAKVAQDWPSRSDKSRVTHAFASLDGHGGVLLQWSANGTQDSTAHALCRLSAAPGGQAATKVGLVSPGGSFPMNSLEFGDAVLYRAATEALASSTAYECIMGSETMGWSVPVRVHMPPAAGAKEALVFLAYGDMGTYGEPSRVGGCKGLPGDTCGWNGNQSKPTVAALAKEAQGGISHLIYHLGDISYAGVDTIVAMQGENKGVLWESARRWKDWLQQVGSMLSSSIFMVAAGNHDVGSGDSFAGDECGRPFPHLFVMPGRVQKASSTGLKSVTDPDGSCDGVMATRIWYGLAAGAAHLIVVSTEHPMDQGSPQGKWLEAEMKSVNRDETPFVIVMGHRPRTTSARVDVTSYVEQLGESLLKHRVDLYIGADAHIYERTAAVDGTVHITSGTGGAPEVWPEAEFEARIDEVWKPDPEAWSLKRLGQVYGFVRVNVDHSRIRCEFVENEAGVLDTVDIAPRKK